MNFVGFSGRYRVQIEGEDPSPWFDNLIMDSGLDQIAMGDYLTWCAVGTGSADPTAGDSALGAPVATSSTLSNSDNLPYICVRTFKFERGTLNATISEVGIGWTSGVSPLFSRAILPVPLLVEADQILYVTYELHTHPCEVDDVYQLQVSGGSITTCTARTSLRNNTDPWNWNMQGIKVEFAEGYSGSPLIYSGEIREKELYPYGDYVEASSIIPIAYVPGTHYLDLEGRWNLDVANFTDGIKSTMFLTNGYGAYQIGFNPPIMKTCYDTFKLVYRVYWGRLA